MSFKGFFILDNTNYIGISMGSTFPANIYLFKANNTNTKKGAKYVQR